MIGEQLQGCFCILALEIIESDWANRKPDGARELAILAPLLDLVNPIGSNRRALNKYGVLHRFVRSGRMELITNRLRLLYWESAKDPRASAAAAPCVVP
jgi:hypothetical protein